MTIYSVSLKRIVAQTSFIQIEAQDEITARELALEAVGPGGENAEWELAEDSGCNVTIEAIDEN